ncbi:Peroxisomal membrane protein PAS20 [Oleoguttula sp. CCFEE 5521]
MSGVSPPKPWERAGAGGASAAMPTSTTAAIPTATSSAAAPTLPARPDSLSTVASRTASNYASPYGRPSPYGGAMGGMGSSPYGYGASSPYSSPMSRFGAGGMGGMSSMYSSPYGGAMGGMGGFGGMYGQQQGMYGAGIPGQDPSLTQSFSQSTQTTFQMIESIVGAFGGFAQMLESTYMATHSSFFAMVSVAEQFGTLRQTLGSVLGIFTLMRWVRVAIAKLTGRPPPASSTELTPANFAHFSAGGKGAVDPSGQPKPSRKPFVVFLLAVFGLPYLMGKLIKALAASQEAEAARQQALAPYDPNNTTQPLDPSQSWVDDTDLAVKTGDLVAVLSKSDPMGQASEWWRCRARDGRMGYLPSTYLETIQRRPQGQAQIAAKEGSEGHSRVNTMTSLGSGASRANSLKAASALGEQMGKVKPEVVGKASDVGVESFQKSAFYS